MVDEKIDILFMQETWVEGDSIFEWNGYVIFNHNFSDIKTKRRGVGIVLSPRMARAWERAGKLDPIKTETGSVFEGRFIGVKCILPRFDARGKEVREHKIFIASVYHPYDDTYKGFNSLWTPYWIKCQKVMS